MLEEHPGVFPPPFSSAFLFMWGHTPYLTSSLPFLLTKVLHYYVYRFVYSVIKRQEAVVLARLVQKELNSCHELD